MGVLGRAGVTHEQIGNQNYELVCCTNTKIGLQLPLVPYKPTSLSQKARKRFGLFMTTLPITGLGVAWEGSHYTL